MQINRRKVFQGLQSTNADPTVHQDVANTLPAIAQGCVEGEDYDLSEVRVFTAAERAIGSAPSEAFVRGTRETLQWMKENGHLPTPQPTESTPPPVEPETNEPTEDDVPVGTAGGDEIDANRDDAPRVDAPPADEPTTQTARKARSTTATSSKKSSKKSSK